MEMIFALAVCLFLIGYGWNMRSRQMETVRLWKRAEGKIVEIGVREEMRTPLDAPGKVLMYAPLVRYRYPAGNETVTGETIRLYDDVACWHSSQKLAQRQARKWKRGETVTVYYDPAHPGRSCIEAVTSTPYLIMGFGLMWLILIPFFNRIMA